ncbi:MAG TPA: DUF5666 domain-containing protein [Thermoanaerobaculia bacterium]
MCLTLFATAASAQLSISATGRWATGTVSGVDGNKVFLFDNRLTVDVSNAMIFGVYGRASVASLTPGTRVSVGISGTLMDGTVEAVDVQILPEHDASIDGLVDHVDVAAGTLRVAGLNIRLTPATQVYRDSDGALVPATHIPTMRPAWVSLDRNEQGLAAKTVVFTPPLANVVNSIGGRISAIDGDRWTIGGGPYATVVRVTDETFLGGDPQIGERVQVSYRGTPFSGDLVALAILRISYIAEEDVAGEVRAITRQTITIDRGQGATTLHLDENTSFRGEPQVGDVVVVRTDGDKAALEVEEIFATDFTFGFAGDLTRIQGNEWTAQGVTFYVTPNTRINGSPQEGDQINVYAMSVNDRWYAMTIDKL